MKDVFAFESVEEYRNYEKSIDYLKTRLRKYQEFLEKNFKLYDCPNGIVWTTKEIGTSVLSDYPIPAFTNEQGIIFAVDEENWRKIFLDVVGEDVPNGIKDFFKEIDGSYLLTILGHELTHHSDYFLDDFDVEQEDGIWFEEGMCDYIPRKFFLTKDEFQKTVQVERELVNFFQGKYGNHSLEEFGDSSYDGSLTSIMYEYWRSFLSIVELVETVGKGDIHKVFQIYHQWDREGRILPLAKYFGLE
ncbi:MAG: hypothetical protein Q4P28_05900 [Tissierellia bacterium]|nr:hypothetical protein [Tissierellia bacterium]